MIGDDLPRHCLRLGLRTESEESQIRAGFLPRVFRVHVPHLNPAAGSKYPLDAVEDSSKSANRR